MTANAHRTACPQRFALGELTACFRAAAMLLLIVVAAFIVLRRVSGALQAPPGTLPLLVAGILLAALAGFAQPHAANGRARAASGLVSLAAIAIAASLSLGGGNPAALTVFWTVVAGGECWAWRGLLTRRQGSLYQPEAQARGPRLPFGLVSGLKATVKRAPPASEPIGVDPLEDPESAGPAADVLQQLTLRATAEGGQELSGWLRIGLAAGQRTGNLHVAFCPPFGQAPRVQAEAVSGPECRIKASQVLPYGARLEVKLDSPAKEEESVLVWFFARGKG